MLDHFQDGPQFGARIRASRNWSTRPDAVSVSPAFWEMRSAARTTGAPVSRCRRRFIFSPRMRESRSPLSLMPARSGNFTGPTVLPGDRRGHLREFLSDVWSRNPEFGRRVRSTMRCIYVARSGSASFGIAVRAAAVRLFIPLTKEPYDRVQQFRFGGGTKF